MCVCVHVGRPTTRSLIDLNVVPGVRQQNIYILVLYIYIYPANWMLLQQQADERKEKKLEINFAIQRYFRKQTSTTRKNAAAAAD